MRLTLQRAVPAQARRARHLPINVEDENRVADMVLHTLLMTNRLASEGML